MVALGRALLHVRRALPDRVDVHLYGGAALLAVGAALYSEPVGRACLVFGALLVFIVYRRPE